jgi:acetyl esterase/lipase
MRQHVLPTLLVFAVLLPAAAATANDAIVPDVVYGHKDGLAMTFDVYKPTVESNGAAVLFMVSGGWRSRWRPPEGGVIIFGPLLEKGFTVFAVRHGSSPRYNIPEIVGDVRRSVRFVRINAERFGIDPERIGVYGGSAGGHLSLVLATASDEGNPDADDAVDRVSDRVAAVVALFPPTDLRPIVPTPPEKNERFPALNFEPERAAEFSPVVHVTSDDPPTLLIHGDKDELVPIRNSESIMEAFKKENVTAELVVIEGAAHGFRGDDNRRASEAAVAWFEKHLAKKAE